MQDVQLTMRIWHKTTERKSSSNPHTTPSASSRSVSPFHIAAASSRLNIPSSLHIQVGPELILTPSTSLIDQQLHHSNSMCCGELENSILSQRFTSFGSNDGRLSSSRTGNKEQPNQQQKRPSSPLNDTITIPVKEIMIVNADTNNKDPKEKQQIRITTIHSGFFEFNMENTNGQLILMAFLKANLSKDKVVEGVTAGYGLPQSPSNITQNTCSTNISFDVEAFTASRMAERLKSESISEKVQRRIHRLVNSLEESKLARVCTVIFACLLYDCRISVVGSES
jgi:hypothetical protein